MKRGAQRIQWRTLRWKLLDDGAACEHMKAMPDSDDWDMQEVRSATIAEAARYGLSR